MTLPPAPSPDWVARLGELRPLHYTTVPAGADLPGHVRAGSAVRRFGPRLVVVQDDVSALALVDLASGDVTPLLLPAGASGERQFSEQRGNKGRKLDLEASCLLPDGRLVAFGSGSTAARERLVLVSEQLEPRVVDAGALYAALRRHPALARAELNLEGAVLAGRRLKLLQRGNGARVGGRPALNAIVELDAEQLTRWLDGAGPAPEPERVTPLALGAVDGVPYGLTDGVLLPGGQLALLASAEDSPDTYRDGAVYGSRVGLLEHERAWLTDILDAEGRPTTLKLEGLELLGVEDDGALELLAVTDRDDPARPAQLASLRWCPP